MNAMKSADIEEGMAELLELYACPLGTPFDEITGMDSLDYVEFMNEVELKFHVTIPLDKLTSFPTPMSLCDWLEKQ